ncbi:type I polyketide synthase [Pseudoalteromonas rubra]|uniref:Non-ribosomal peptide synthetase n=1 Tax=Pseudoalteromonas rubra TaxID=43658 RepID=A0A0F4QHA7_9GAMM|nr:type I polyketide synthase [Pseudoalteromonas rubra]KJZ06714.1 hypothetical protein TW77_18075 [Pseudoalteromonas rubra]
MSSQDKNSLLEEKKKKLLKLLQEKQNNQGGIVKPNELRKEFPLSYNQQGVWLVNQVEGASHHYNAPAVFDIKGGFSIETAELAFKKVIAEHEILRTSYHLVDGQLVQKVNESAEFCIQSFDLSDASDDELNDLVKKQTEHQFDFENELMLRVSYIKRANNKATLICNIHHIACDGYSLKLIFSCFCRHYESLISGHELELSKRQISYGDFAVWQRERFGNGATDENNLGYWQAHLDGALRTIPIPSSVLKKNAASLEGGVYHFEIDSSLQSAIGKQLEAYGVTWHMWLHAIYAVLLHCVSSRRDILIRTPFANRANSQLKDVVGMFTNELLLRTKVDPNARFSDLLKEIKTTNLNAQDHQDVPSELLMQMTSSEHGSVMAGESQVALRIDDHQLESFNFSNCELILEPVELRYVKYDLILAATFSNAQLQLMFEYRKEAFSREDVAALSSGLISLIEHVCKDEQQRIGELRLVPKSNSLIPSEINHGETSANSFIEAFEQNVLNNPSSLAIVEGERKLRYLELNTEAQKIATALQARQVKQGDLVAISLQKRIENLAAMIAVQKLGSPFVLLSDKFPHARKSYILDDCKASILITDSQHGEFKQVITVPYQALITTTSEFEPVEVRLTKDSTAYVCYTSGTSGYPKGAEITHDGILNLSENMRVIMNRFFDNDTSLRWTTHATPSFDASLQVVSQLPNNVTIVSCLNENDPKKLVRFLFEHDINVFDCTPSQVELMLPYLEQSDSDKRIVFVIGGEPISKALWLKIAQLTKETNIRAINVYGLTECAVNSTFAEITGDTPHIGKPLNGVELCILSENGKPLPQGLPGELYIGGRGLAKSYINNFELTQERFVTLAENNHKRAYKTGDLCRLNEFGNIEFLGRVDDQIKIRGYRLELSEIEHQLMQLDEIEQAVSTVAGDGEHKYIVAYLKVCGNSSHQAVLDKSVQHLGEQLPSYMLPSSFLILDQIPLTTHGKVDKSQLPNVLPGAHLERDKLTNASSTLEDKLLELWQKILQRQDIGLADNFFDVGGNSLLGVHLANAIGEAFSIELSVRDIFQYPTISSLQDLLSDTHKTPDDSETDLSEESLEQPDIAIIGYSGRFPDANNADELWTNIKEAKESLNHYSDEELLEAGVSPEVLKSANYIKSGITLDNIKGFDAEYFGMTPNEAKVLDPQQRLLFECATEALEHAGYGDTQSSQKIGVFCGTGESQYFFNHILPNKDIINSQGLKALHANSPAFTATRLAYQLNLTGPAINVLTACSTSLVAVHQACMSLKSAECHTALAGGASVRKFAKEGYQFEDGNILSSDGHCRTFDQNASGTREGDGGGFVVLKLLQKALADGDDIHAVIKGSAINNDGNEKAGYVAPSVSGQAQVIKDAIKNAKIPSHTIGYIETHGTGTKIGDPLEIEALKQVFDGKSQQQTQVALGALKPNIGHLDTGAGIAGLMKVIMALKSNLLPPTINFDSLNENIDLGKHLYINNKLTQWPDNDYPKRAGISAFGVGGTNAHIILEQAPLAQAELDAEPAHTLLLSAKSEQALKDVYSRHRAFFHELEECDSPYVAYTSQVGVRHHEYRRAIVYKNISDLLIKLDNFGFKRVTQSDKAPSTIAMFSGQGTHFEEMGVELFNSEPVFKASIIQCRDILNPLLGIDIVRLFEDQEQYREVILQGETWILQPLLFAIEYGIYKLLENKGIQFDAMIGHSLGEYVAACIAGVFSLADALKVVVSRGRLMHQTQVGAMLSVLADHEKVKSIIGQCNVAAVNSERHCVLSGTVESVEQWRALLKESGIRTKLLNTKGAYHSALMEPILEEFRAVIESVQINQPTIPIVSNVTGQYLNDEVLTATYWVEHIKETVWFADGIERIANTSWLNDKKLFIEIGPSSGLASFVRDNSSLHSPDTLQTMTKSQSAYSLIQTVTAKSWELGARIDWHNMQRPRKMRTKALPCYPFQRSTHWVDKITHDHVSDRKVTGLTSNDVSDYLYEPVWMAKFIDEECSESRLNPKSAVIFVDKHGLYKGVVEKLKSNSCRVYTVSLLEGGGEDDCVDYFIEKNEFASYSKVLGDIKKKEPGLDLIIHAFNVQADSDFDIHNQDDYFELGAYSLLYLAQGLHEHFSDQENCVLKVLGTNTLNVGQSVNPFKQALTASVRVIENELPFISSQLIDVSEVIQQGSVTQLPNSCMQTILGEVEHQVVAIKNGVPWYRQYQKVSVTHPLADPSKLPVKANNVYLITGGSGGIGLEVANFLSEHSSVEIVLVSRTPIPERASWNSIIDGEDDTWKPVVEKIKAVESKGSRVHTYTADISDCEQFTQTYQAIVKEVGKPNGIFHTAGVPGGRLLSLLSKQDAQKVFAPKVAGSLNILKTIDLEYVDFVINFSSISALNGSIGQFDYATANAFQDGLSNINALCQQKVKTINWDTWKEVGMAVKSVAPKGYQTLLEQQLKSGLENNEGLKALSFALSCNKRHLVVSKSSTPPHFDIPFDLELIKDAGLVKSSDDSNHDRTITATEQSMKNLWKDILGVEVMSRSDDFFELGGDSLSLSKLLAHINHQWQLNLSLKQAFEKTDFHSMLRLVEGEQGQSEDNEHNAKLAQLWFDVIGVEVSSAEDDFFDMGGDSLSLSKLVVHINHTWNTNIPVKDAFESTQFAKMLDLINESVALSEDKDAEIEEGVL